MKILFWSALKKLPDKQLRSIFSEFFSFIYLSKSSKISGLNSQSCDSVKMEFWIQILNFRRIQTKRNQKQRQVMLTSNAVRCSVSSETKVKSPFSVGIPFQSNTRRRGKILGNASKSLKIAQGKEFATNWNRLDSLTSSNGRSKSYVRTLCKLFARLLISSRRAHRADRRTRSGPGGSAP